MKNFFSFLKGGSLLSLSFILLLSLISYRSGDIQFLSYPVSNTTHNLIGILGAYISFALFFVLGWAAYFLPFYCFCLSWDEWKLFRFHGFGRGGIKLFSFFFFTIFLAAFIGLFFVSETAVFKNAGIAGFFISGIFKKYLGLHGAFIITALILIINSLLLFAFFFVDVFAAARNYFREALKKSKENRVMADNKTQDKSKKEKVLNTSPADKQTCFSGRQAAPIIKIYTPKVEAVSGKQEKDIIPSLDAGQYRSKIESKYADAQINNEDVKKKIDAVENQTDKKFNPRTYKLPSYNMLKIPQISNELNIKEDIESNIKNLEETLSEFGVAARVVSVQKGPVVTMYELEPHAGVKIQKISALADDIALAMKSSQVRVAAPLPGRGTVGVEIPNEKKQLVYLREVLEEKVFLNAPSKLTLIIGKDVSGNPVTADLKDMPHILIAGTTGAGKTVCVNSLICSILFKAKPDEVNFLLIDPKMVELAPFSGIPHLIHPVICETKKAFLALGWAVEEMERRYKLLAKQGARNIDIYNTKEKDKLSYIVIVIDELADLMIVAKESIEVSIQRLAQLSRAVGIHLILATQRPSVDVITGVIKANFPARISFKVSAKVDSRTVLDMMGADKLLGKGDLLFLKPGATKLIRAQGAFIDDEGIESLVNFIRAQGSPVYAEGILEGEKKKAFDVEGDELFDEAVKTVLQSRQASASILQRRMRVGYTRAARLLDIMEQEGIVGPFCGSKAREILVDPESYLTESMKSRQ